MTYRLSLKTAPAAEPVTRAEAKAHCRITTISDDSYVDTLITAARTRAETILAQALINRTYNFYLDEFGTEIALPHPPLSSVSSIKYTDPDGIEQTLSTGVYTVDTVAYPGRVYLAYGQSWPSVRSIPKTVNIEYVAGYGTAGSSVPAPFRQAILLMVEHWYRNRSAVSDFPMTEVPLAAQSLLATDRMFTF